MQAPTSGSPDAPAVSAPQTAPLWNVGGAAAPFGQAPAAPSASAIFGQQPIASGGFPGLGAPAVAAPRTAPVWNTGTAGAAATAPVAAPVANGSGLDEKIAEAREAMACIDATMRTVLVSAHAMLLQGGATGGGEGGGGGMAFVYFAHSQLLPPPPPPPRTATQGLQPPTQSCRSACSACVLPYSSTSAT